MVDEEEVGKKTAGAHTEDTEKEHGGHREYRNKIKFVLF
jgi:hypothetical protein